MLESRPLNLTAKRLLRQQMTLNQQALEAVLTDVLLDMGLDPLDGWQVGNDLCATRNVPDKTDGVIGGIVSAP